MKILVTGGTGVLGDSVVRELHRRGHAVRVLSRHAGRDGKRWSFDSARDGLGSVESWAGDISNERSIRGAAEGCDAVLHIAGIVQEKPPATYQSVNIDGTRYVVLECERAEVRKLVYISSLGAERGHSAYHRSKRVGEDVVRAFSRDWIVLRPGAVYGPGDEHISVLVRMVRTLPLLPTIGDGNQPFQPVWHEDLSQVLATALERDDLRCATYDIAGPDVTSQNDLVGRLRGLTNRAAVQAPLPELVASWGMRALDAMGVDVPFSEAQLEMLRDGNVLQDSNNALVDVFGVRPTRLDDGLRRLLDTQPDQLTSQGVGALTRKRFWIDIRGSAFTADSLFEYLREHLIELMPDVVRMNAEPHASGRIEVGETLTLEIPVRGHVQVRVVEVASHRITMLTVVGHPIAGAVRFLVEARGEALRFEIQVFDRAATMVDQFLMYAAGEWLQREAWAGLATNVARVVGGTCTPVQTLEAELDADEAARIDEWTAELSSQTSRKSTSSGRD
jgi:NADH dehydrogenase